MAQDNDVRAKLLQKLDLLKCYLTDNWNGEGDLPIEDKAYINTRLAIQNTPVEMLEHWRLLPVPNGTLLLSPKGSYIAGISIGNEEFSYGAYLSEDKQIDGNRPFDIEAFKEVLIQIHRLLGLI